jgi:hypothetical protein
MINYISEAISLILDGLSIDEVLDKLLERGGLFRGTMGKLTKHSVPGVHSLPPIKVKQTAITRGVEAAKALTGTRGLPKMKVNPSKITKAFY